MAAAVRVHPLSNNPTKCWSQLAVKQKVETVEPIPWETPVTEDKMRFVCLSDTHGKYPTKVPIGDVLLHAGDFTKVGLVQEIKGFNDYLSFLPHPVKVVIAGNHDMTFDDEMVKRQRQDMKLRFDIDTKRFEDKLSEYGMQSVRELLTSCVYLEDGEISICGINIYGSPWTPRFCDYGFNADRGEECLEKWKLIPDHTDILITHGPPVGHGDMCFDGGRAGCVELLSTIQNRVKPNYHIFGHIHEGYGITTDGTTQFINASTCDLRYKPEHRPIIFDLPIPAGHSKQELVNVIQPQRIMGK